MRIAVDLMGGDREPASLMPAIQRSLDTHPDSEFLLVGDESLVPGELASDPRIEVQHAADVVRMDDTPGQALRSRRQSSMYEAVSAVANEVVDACVSAGNTGALMAMSRHVLKTLPGVDRPAIIKGIPSVNGSCYLLDLGANINCTAHQLVQFAAMGSVMCGAVEGIERPKVGLLNIGQEEGKGEEAVREAAEMLRANAGINFIGFVEGDGIYQSDADVLVCDGWVGNVALKTSEGLARFVAHMINQAFRKDFTTRAAALVFEPVLRSLEKTLSPENYNGATLLGLTGIVVKSHGSANETGFFHAIEETRRCVEQGIPALLGERIAELTG